MCIRDSAEPALTARGPSGRGRRCRLEARMRRSWILFANALLLPCTLHAQADVTSWIRTNAVPLKTVEARHGFDDMEPLRRIIGDARIVSLGEATHGTREFFQLKHRMLEFLATQMGFTCLLYTSDAADERSSV